MLNNCDSWQQSQQSEPEPDGGNTLKLLLSLSFSFSFLQFSFALVGFTLTGSGPVLEGTGLGVRGFQVQVPVGLKWRDIFKDIFRIMLRCPPAFWTPLF